MRLRRPGRWLARGLCGGFAGLLAAGPGYVYEGFEDEGSDSNTDGHTSGVIGLDGSVSWDAGGRAPRGLSLAPGRMKIQMAGVEPMPGARHITSWED